MKKRPKHFNRTAHLPQNIRVEEEVRAALDQYAARKGIPASTAVHNLVIEGLRKAGDLMIVEEKVTETLIRGFMKRREWTEAWDPKISSDDPTDR